jgi:hypothetical protein
MGSGVDCGDRLIPPGAGDFPVHDNDGADRNFAPRLAVRGALQGRAHEPLVFHAVECAILFTWLRVMWRSHPTPQYESVEFAL